MNAARQLLLGLIFSVTVAAHAALPLALNLTANTAAASIDAWPTLPPLPLPDGLRPCCAFGYNLHARVFGLPVPWYQLNNIVTANELGRHQYNDNPLAALANLSGISSENNGIVYTTRGGFIDTAHVRDTADMTLYIFSQLRPKLGQAFPLNLDEELAGRRLIFYRFSPPTRPAERYTLAAWLAAYLAFQVAEWHEIAQGYGLESVPGFSEAVSAFSPEDLYSNLLGARLAVSLILDGQVKTQGMYQAAMTTALTQALQALGAQPASITRFQFDMLDGCWWDSQRRVPDKNLVLMRNFAMGDNRLATPVPGEQTPPLRLMLPHRWRGYVIPALAQIQLRPGAHPARLPARQGYAATDFTALATAAKKQMSQRPLRLCH